MCCVAATVCWGGRRACSLRCARVPISAICWSRNHPRRPRASGALGRVVGPYLSRTPRTGGRSDRGQLYARTLARPVSPPWFLQRPVQLPAGSFEAVGCGARPRTECSRSRLHEPRGWGRQTKSVSHLRGAGFGRALYGNRAANPAHCTLKAWRLTRARSDARPAWLWWGLSPPRGWL